MPYFLAQAAYTPQAWSTMAKNPVDREQVFRGLIEKAGGKLHSFYFSVGEYDAIGILEAPDLATAAAISIAVSSAGHVKSYKTTPLLTAREGMSAMEKAGGFGFRAPGS
ncbi:MAG TPA: GYD domain-containing protein [Thermoanaerobaculia bacterium]|jgi:uncharacterized protein with GYD domain